jgi:hypothetical protein
VTEQRGSGCLKAFLIVLAVVLATCIAGAVWMERTFGDRPPSIGAPYDEGEAFLVMEAFAGELIAALPSDPGSPRFSYRSWDSKTCT